MFTCEDISKVTVNGYKDERTIVPKKLIIRLIGGMLMEKKEDARVLTEANETLVYYKAGELGLGPKLYGSFEGGRIEEYIPSHTLTDEELQDPAIRDEIAKKMARYHSIDLPISRKRRDYLGIGLRSFKTLFNRDEFLANEGVRQSGANLDLITSFDVIGEYQWLHTIEPLIISRTVFCLGDCQRLNCLVRDNIDTFGERVTLIDYEASGYHSRAADIGRLFFCAWLEDLKQPEFMSQLDYPSEEIQREFIASYLQETKKLNYFDFDDQMDSVDQVLKETNFHSMYTNLFFISFQMTFYKKMGCNPLVNSQLISLFTVSTKLFVASFILINSILQNVAEKYIKLYVERKKQIIDKYSYPE